MISHMGRDPVRLLRSKDRDPNSSTSDLGHGRTEPEPSHHAPPSRPNSPHGLGRVSGIRKPLHFLGQRWVTPSIALLSLITSVFSCRYTQDQAKSSAEQVRITKEELAITKEDLRLTKEDLKIHKEELQIARDVAQRHIDEIQFRAERTADDRLKIEQVSGARYSLREVQITPVFAISGIPPFHTGELYTLNLAKSRSSGNEYVVPSIQERICLTQTISDCKERQIVALHLSFEIHGQRKFIQTG